MQTVKTVAFHTLGCKLNFSETSSISRTMEQDGFIKKGFDEVADVYVINTCAVTESAEKECRQIVRRIQRINPEGLVVVIGCYAQIKPKEIATTLDANYWKGLDNHQARTGIAVPVLTPDRVNKRQNGRRFKEDGDPSFTLTGQDKHGVYDGIKIRRLTPTECERLQGFPDGWTEGVSDTQRYKCLGNAVTVNVVYEIARRLQ